MSRSQRIVYAGTPDFAVPALEALVAAGYHVVAVYTQPDRPAGRGRKLTPSPVKRAAEAHGLPVCQPENFKAAEDREQLAAFEPDLMVVAAYGLLLPQSVLDIPCLGCINIHASLLPRWRGAAPIHRAILAGDRQTGVTIMQMAAGLDTGDMLAKRRCPIGAEDTAGSLHDRLADLGAEALVDILPDLFAGNVTPEPQDDSEATYARKLEKSEAWIDWHRPAVTLARQVMAFNPWPVAQTTWNEQVIRVWEAEALPDVDVMRATPGEVLQASEHGIDVATADGALRIHRLQLPGRRATAAGDFVNAFDVEGAIFE